METTNITKRNLHEMFYGTRPIKACLYSRSALMQQGLFEATEHQKVMDSTYHKYLFNPEKSIPSLNIPDELQEMLIQTENDYSERQFFLDEFFINQRVLFKDNNRKFCSAGINIINYKRTEDAEDKLDPEGRVAFSEVLVEDLNKDEEIVKVSVHIIGVPLETTKEEDEVWFRKTEASRDYIKACLKIKNYVLNVCDFVNNNVEDYDLTTVKADVRHDIKRHKRGKHPISTTVTIRPKQHFQEQLNKFAEHKGYSHMFIVRGHWRRLQSDRYKETKGQKVWIKPHWKGKGIKVQKNYKIQR